MNYVIFVNVLFFCLMVSAFGAMEADVAGDYTFQWVEGTNSDKWVISIYPDNEALLIIEMIGTGASDRYSWTNTCNGTLTGRYDPDANQLTIDGYYLERDIKKFLDSPSEERITEMKHHVTLKGRWIEGNLVCNMTNIVVSLNNKEISSNPFVEEMKFVGQQKKTISGHVFNDTNANRLWERTEPGMAEWRINLDGITEVGSKVFLDTSTNLTGYYQFRNISPGSYQISEVKKYDPASFKRWNQTCQKIKVPIMSQSLTLISRIKILETI